jgi:imidazolonepropionase-like amidohydrolase
MDMLIRILFVALATVITSLSIAADRPIALVGGMLLDGYDAPPIHHSVVIIEGNKIAAAGTRQDTPIPENAYLIDTSGKAVLPGLIDLHGHLMLIGHGDYEEYFDYIGETKRLPEIYAIAARQLLQAGVTTFVDLGSPEGILETKKQIGAGQIPGPRLIVSGPWISRLGIDIVPAETGYIVKSSDEAAARTIEIIDKGFDVIKVWEGLTQEDYNVVVREAHKRGVKVHAHLYEPEKVEFALNAGVDVLQHMGSARNAPYSQELISRIAHSGKPVIQTIAHRIWIYPETVDFPERLQDSRLQEVFPPDLYEEIQRSVKYFHRRDYFREVELEIRNSKIAARQFIESGAVIGVGTDSGSPLNFHTEALWREMGALVDAGMTPTQVISAATKTNGEILGSMQLLGGRRQVGTIEPGMFADVIVVDGDPRYSMSILNEPDLVIKDGVPWYTEQQATKLLREIGREL